MPGYVKTQEEIERIKKFMMPARFIGEELGVTFQTTWDYAREVLPPMFEPAGSEQDGQNEACAIVGNWQSAYCGDFEGAFVRVMCKHGEVEGWWTLVLLMAPELALTSGREILGEPKKMGSGTILRDGVRQRAIGERMGIDIIQIEADIDGPELGPKEFGDTSFEIKMFPDINSTALEYPAKLYTWQNNYTFTSYREGTGSLTWGHSKWDPVDTIPIVSTGPVVAANYAAVLECDAGQQLDDPEGVLPQYLWGRSFDDPTWYRIPERWKGADELNPDPDLESLTA